MRFSKLSRSASIEFGFHCLGIRNGINFALDMRDVTSSLKAAQYMRYGVHLANIGEELVAQSFAFAGAAYQPGKCLQK